MDKDCDWLFDDIIRCVSARTMWCLTCHCEEEHITNLRQAYRQKGCEI